MECVLITGASGQLGLALYKLLNDNKDYELVRTVRKKTEDGLIDVLDITDEDAVNNMVGRIKPDIIINTAAFNAVDLCESEQEKAYSVNALGPLYLARAADKYNSKLIHISTDYVYDGRTTKSYVEGDRTNPLSVYGKTKLKGDINVSSSCSKYFILRTAWVYGEGKNFVRTMLRLSREGNRIRVVSDQYGTPTSALQLAKVIIYLMRTQSYGLYHTTCEGSTNWYEFAKKIFSEAGIDVTVEAIKTSDYKSVATRPIYSVLDNKALKDRHGYYMKDWKEALREYMKS